MIATNEEGTSEGQTDAKDPWRGFKPGLWQRDINVRWFLQQNYTPYEGDAAFGTSFAGAREDRCT